MKLFHRHDWNTVAVRLMRARLLGGPPSDVTLVLQRCSCGDARTRTFQGHWSAADLKGLS